MAGYGDALRQVRSEDVRASLKQDEISIEFIHYRENGQGRPDSVLYGALVLWPDSLYPTFVPLCKEDDVDKLVRSATVRVQTMWTSCIRCHTADLWSVLLH